MSKSPTLRRTMVTATTVLLMLGTTGQALAQRSVEERRQRSEQRGNRGGNEAKAEQYPDATRKQPDAKASTRGQARLQKLFKAYEGEDLAQAQPLADEIIADEKANAYEKAISARLIGALLIGEEPVKATDYLQRALAFDGLSNNEHYETMLIVSQLQLQEEQYEEGLATLDRLQSETGSKLAEHDVLRGNAYYRLERYPEAITALRAAVDASPEPRPEWLQLLMASYAETEQYAEATKLAEEIAAKAPADKQSQMNLAVVYMQAEQYDKAAAVYEKLRAAGELTEDRDYRNLMALYLNAGEKEKEAIAVIDEGLEKGILKPDHQTYVALAQAYYFSEQIDKSIDAYRKAAPLAPNGETYLNLARALHGEGRLAEAKQAAQQALDKGVKSPQDAQRILAQKGG